MHSNFITPPDYVETILIVNATQDIVAELTQTVKTADRPYNIYFYNDLMNEHDWFDLIKSKADVVLDANLASPLDYFNK